jgi:hypothetical protein
LKDRNNVSTEDQHAPPSAPESAEQIRAGISLQGAARRRFTRAGMGASGIIMTLSSQPGMATTTVCRPASGFLSGTWASSNPKQDVLCWGLKPEVWCANWRYWESLAKQPFITTFPCTSKTSGLKKYTMLQVISGTPGRTNDPNEVGKFMVAAWLNAGLGATPVLDRIKLKQIWDAYKVSLHYKPDGAYETWDGAMIVEYIKSTIYKYPTYIPPKSK